MPVSTQGQCDKQKHQHAANSHQEAQYASYKRVSTLANYDGDVNNYLRNVQVQRQGSEEVIISSELMGVTPSLTNEFLHVEHDVGHESHNAAVIVQDSCGLNRRAMQRQ